MEVRFAPIWPWPVVLLTAVGLVLFVVATYRVQTGGLTPLRRRWLLGFKLLAAAILIFAMFRPAVQFSEKDDNTVQLLVAADVSRSMNTADGPANTTRLQAALKDLEGLSSQWKVLAEKVIVRRFEFDKDARPARETIAQADGDFTALGVSLETLLREVRQERTVGILLLSDGAQRALPPFDVDPLQAARKLAAEQAPVYPIGYGATSLSSTTVDLALADLLIDPVVFEKKRVPLKVQLKASGAARKKATLRVLVEDRGNKPNGEPGVLVKAPFMQQAKVETEVVLRGDTDVQTIDLSFVPQRPGEVKVAVEVVALEGEVLTRNNRLETIITVRQGGLRVAYFDTARPEQKFLRMVNGADKIQLDWFEIRRGRFRGQTKIDPAIFEPGAYDVYLLGDVPADVFGPVLLNKLTERVQAGSGLMMLGGLENYSAGGYAKTSLADLLPVTMLEAAGTGPDRVGQLDGPQPMLPTDTGLKRFVMQLAATDKNRAKWEALAPLVGATKLQPKNELVEVWAQSKDGTPLLCATEVGKARVAAFGGDTTYQWVLHKQADEHQRFWRQMILWLARKDADTNQAVWAKVEPRNFAPGATVPLEFGARNETGAPLPDADFTVEVTRPDGKKESVAVRKAGDSSFGDFKGTEQPGDYWVRVSARSQGALVGLDASTRFIVDPTDLELDQPNADYETLQKIAEITGGQLLRPEDLAGFVKRLSDMKLEDLTRVSVLPLWDNWWLLLAFTGVMTTEWALRKRWGLA